MSPDSHTLTASGAPTATSTQPPCRSCGGTHLASLLDLGEMPLADRLLTESMLADPEPRYPLELAFCPDCALVQITCTVPPEDLFCRDYPYYSSFSPALLAHSRNNARALYESRRLDGDSLVVEIASNDGYLLKNFVEWGVPVLGIDPAEGPVRSALEAGVRSWCRFFGPETAEAVIDEHGKADVVIGNNVLAHVADTNGFVASIARVLKDDGVASIEMPYVRDLIDHVEFDTIYHEHLCYFSLTALDRLFRPHGLHLQDVFRLPIHGGSLRIHVGHADAPSAAVTNMLAEERRLGLDTVGFYRDFADRVTALKAETMGLLRRLKADGARIAAYGAAAKGATLINAFGIDAGLVDYVVDRNHHKHGRYMPGMRLPIRPVDALREDAPDYLLLLAWNFADEIMAQQAAFAKQGGRFIVPIPHPRILSGSEEH